MNKLAQALGRMAKGKPKNYTKAELARRTKRLAEARKALAARRKARKEFGL